MIRKISCNSLATISLLNSDRLNNIELQDKLYKLLFKCLYDADVDVRKACFTPLIFVLSTFTNEKLLKKFNSYEKSFKKGLSLKRQKNNDWIKTLHGAVIGLTALLSLNISEIESYTPNAIVLLLKVVSYPSPVGDSAKQFINMFKKIYQDNWNRCEESFDEDQLDSLKETLVSSGYFS